MALRGGPAQSFRGRSGFLLLSGGLLAITLILVAAACGGDGAKDPAAPPNTSPGDQGALTSTLVTMYSSPT
jgi:hypothetical protein